VSKGLRILKFPTSSGCALAASNDRKRRLPSIIGISFVRVEICAVLPLQPRSESVIVDSRHRTVRLPDALQSHEMLVIFSPSVLAFVTTIHLAMVVLRAHRSPAAGAYGFVTFVSVLFAGSPWLMSSLIGLVAGFVVHVGWFAACEQLLPGLATKTPKRVATPTSGAAPRPTGMAQMARRPAEWVKAPVVAVFDETPDVRTFRMARPEGFEFKAGQFLTVRVRADGKEHVRCYSISSPPDAKGHLEITVKRIGLVSGALHATVRPGSMLSVRPPGGAFVYPTGEDRPLVLIAGGVGITPLMSMLRHAIDAEPWRPVTLFYSVRTVEDIAFRDEIQMLARRHAQFQTFFAISDGPAGPEFFPGRINEALLITGAPDIVHAVCLICGPPPMLDGTTALLTKMGVPQPQISFEIFQAAVAASAGGPPLAKASPAKDVAHGLRFERSGSATTVDTGQTMLEAAEACGVAIPSLCRSGVCGTCRTQVLSGDVQCASQMLDAQDRQDGFVLACVTRIESDCTIDA
jgi:ferredoxin-NADP reductase